MIAWLIYGMWLHSLEEYGNLGYNTIVHGVDGHLLSFWINEPDLIYGNFKHITIIHVDSNVSYIRYISDTFHPIYN